MTDPRLRRRQVVFRFLGLLLLAFLAYPIVGLADQNPLLYLALAGFTGAYTLVIWRNAPQLHSNRAPLALVAAMVCGSLLVPTLGFDWFSGLSFFASVMLFINFPLHWWRAILAGLIAGSVGVSALVLGAAADALLILTLQVLIGSGLQVAIYKQLKTSNELHRARIELAQLAVAEERLRIARDLHDILGQRLSAITLKAQVAARIIESNPQQAIIEMTEVGALARDGLAAARAAVSGYRQISLAAEASAAEVLLKTAGLAAAVSVPVSKLPTPVDECAGWVVREAVTNTLRHARASHCEIEVVCANGYVVVEVRDDGVGMKLEDPPTYGIGLTGLTERVGILGGELSIEIDDWFRVRARLPVDPTGTTVDPVKVAR